MRTHEGNGQPRRRQGIVAGHGTKVRGWDRICREAGTRGAWGDLGRVMSRGSRRTPCTGSSGTIGVRRTRCSVGGSGDSGARRRRLSGHESCNSAVWGPGLATVGEGGCAEAFCY